MKWDDGLDIRRHIFFCAVILVVVLAPGSGFVSETSPPVVLSDGWTMRWGDGGGWASMNGQRVLPRNGPDEVLWLQHLLPEKKWRDPALLVGIFLPFEAVVDGASIYRAGRLSPAYANKFQGIQWHLIALPLDFVGRNLRFQIYVGGLKLTAPEFQVVVGNRADLVLRLQRDLDQVFLGCALVLIGLVGGYIYLRRDEHLALSFGALSFCAGLYSIAGADVFCWLFPLPAVQWYLFYLGLFFFPIGMWAFWDDIFAPSRLAVFLRLWQFHLIFALVFLTLDLISEAPFSESVLFFWYMMIGEIALAILVASRYMRSSRVVNTEMRILSVGLIGLSIFGLHDILQGLQVLPWDFFAFHWGIFLFILLSGYLLKRRLFEGQRQLQK